MKLNERQKMCSSCDGRIPLDANLCPYCAAEQGTTGQVYLQHKSIQESLTSLYPPPYATKNTQKNPTLSSAKEAPLEKKTSAPTFTGSSPALQNSLEEQVTDEKHSFWPTLFLSIGAQLLVLGFLQFFFSESGFLTLQWDSRYWFAYCLAALPLFYLGTSKLKKHST